MRPSFRSVLLVAGGFPFALLPALVHPGLWGVWLGYAGLCALALVIDGVFAAPPRRIEVELDAPTTLYVGDAHPLVAIVAMPRWKLAIRAELLVETGVTLHPPAATRVSVPGRGTATAEFELRPRRRGQAEIESVWLRWSGPLGLIERRKRVTVGRQIPVVPNVRAVRDAALRLLGHKEFLSGLKTERYPGDGSEFESLREFTPGLDHRAINWKASARHRKLLCQEFRAERNHQVVLALDSGHLMREPFGGIAKLDHAINAGLLLSYLALRSGDRVGLCSFDRGMRSYTEPAAGVQSFRRLQHQSAQIEYSTEETNFTLGLAELATRLRRRSLIVLLTDFVDTISAELMIENMARLVRRHLVLFVSLRDPDIRALRDAEPTTADALHRAVVASDFQREREVVLERLRRLGVWCVNAAPAEISIELLNRYLDIQRRELI